MPDSLQAGAGVRVDAAGHVTYDFDGHVHARGLDLDSGLTGLVNPADNSIRWLDQGTEVAQLISFFDNVNQRLQVFGLDPSTGNQAGLDISVRPTDHYAAIFLTLPNGAFKLLLDTNNSSDFVLA